MNKKRVNSYIPLAQDAIRKVGIADKEDKVDGNYRSHISSFGAAIILGSLKAAVAFFSTKGSSDVERPDLLRAMYYIITNGEILLDANRVDKVLKYVCNVENEIALKESFINAAVALKLALNSFDLGKKVGDGK